MFLTLKQALAASDCGTAFIDGPKKGIARLREDGGIQLSLKEAHRTVLYSGDSEYLDRQNRKLVLKGVNCRPMYR